MGSNGSFPIIPIFLFLHIVFFSFLTRYVSCECQNSMACPNAESDSGSNSNPAPSPGHVPESPTSEPPAADTSPSSNAEPPPSEPPATEQPPAPKPESPPSGPPASNAKCSISTMKFYMCRFMSTFNGEGSLTFGMAGDTICCNLLRSVPGEEIPPCLCRAVKDMFLGGSFLSFPYPIDIQLPAQCGFTNLHFFGC